MIEFGVVVFKDKMPFDMSWIVKDFRKYLARECDFVQEANNAERVAAMFENNPNVLVILKIAQTPIHK